MIERNLNPNLFGIAGNMGSGKSTACEILKEENIICEILNFSTGVKELARDYFDIPLGGIKDNRKRECYQAVGQKMRHIQMSIDGISDIWISHTIRKAVDSDCAYGIGDVRYINEIKAIIENGGIVILLTAPQKLSRKRIEKREGKKISDAKWKKHMSHSSEHDVKSENFWDLLNGRYYDNVIHIRQENDDLKNFKRLLLAGIKDYVQSDTI